jgi:hypothetical protein
LSNIMKATINTCTIPGRFCLLHIEADLCLCRRIITASSEINLEKIDLGFERICASFKINVREMISIDAV